MMCETRLIHSGLSHRPRAAHDRMSGRGIHQHHQNQTLHPATAGGYDFTTLARYHSGYPLLSGGRNGFPRRVPTASSDKLRQMYYKTDRLSGRIVFNNVHHQATQRRLANAALFESIDVGIEEPPDKQIGEHERDDDEGCDRRLTTTPTIPPPHSARGLTVITQRAVRTREQRTDNSPHNIGSHQTQLSVYLPRVDQPAEEHDDTTPKVIHKTLNTSSTRPSTRQTLNTPPRRKIRPHTAKW